MPGVRVPDPTGPGVDHTGERGEEHFLAELPELIGRGRDRVTRLEIGRQRGAQELLAAQGEDSFDRAVTRDVDDHDADPIVLEEHDVVAVAGDDSFGGPQLRGQRPPARQRADLGLEVRSQREQHGRALFDRSARAFGVGALLFDPRSHGVDVGRQLCDLRRADGSDRLLRFPCARPPNLFTEIVERARDPAADQPRREQRARDRERDHEDDEQRETAIARPMLQLRPGSRGRRPGA